MSEYRGLDGVPEGGEGRGERCDRGDHWGDDQARDNEPRPREDGKEDDCQR